MKNFAIIGAAGYIAERHLRAIKETNNNLVCATDKFDVMGRIDSYFPDAEFFLEYENFDKHIDDLRANKTPVDYITICTPNYLHHSHIRFALRNGTNAICEKPLVIYPEDIQVIKKLEAETGKKVNTVLQLRHHEKIIELKNKVQQTPGKIYNIDLTYITTRGKWYFKSWKADINKSGGVSTNIGIHFFDMLTWIFGDVQKNVVHIYTHNKAAGYLELKNARIRWFLSLDYNDLPKNIKQQKQRTFREITIDNQNIEFSNGFTNLHTVTYKNILAGKGFGITDAEKSIEITHQIRNTKPSGLINDYHPILKNN